MDSNGLYPNLKQSIWLAFLLLVFQVAFGAVFGILFVIIKNDFDTVLISLFPTNLLSFGLVILLVRNKTKHIWAETLQLFSFRYIIILPLFPLLIGLGIIASEADNLLTYIMPKPEFIQSLWQI